MYLNWYFIMSTERQSYEKIRLLLGDQLNHAHSWFSKVDNDVIYVLMEVKSETSYVTHHIQKILGFFAAMRNFSDELKELGHKVHYMSFDHQENEHSFTQNLEKLIEYYAVSSFEYQLPDEYRLDQLLKNWTSSLDLTCAVVDSEHFLTTRTEWATFFEGHASPLMERFYRYMRVKHRILVDELDQPFFGQWNLDKENRDKLPANHLPTPPRLFDNDLSLLHQMIVDQGIPFIGSVDAKHFIWPINRTQALELVDFFVEQCLPLFGRFEDAMSIHSWSVYHSRLSFALNLKMISPLEVVQRAIHHWEKNQSEISPNQLEGFVRQIIGWREYMRGVYWSQMPGFASANALNHDRKLPNWFWTGDTKMNCLKHAINQSLNFAYAHHIQRLMVTGNFALLAGIHPDEVDQWYLGIYIDAIEWVEITNTRGMSQYADGGFVATKPYVSSAAYIDKMSDYCKTCYYTKSLKTGEKSCPFNSLYWHFLEQHRSVFEGQFRMKMMYAVLNKMKVDQRSELMVQAEKYLDQIESL